MQGQPDTVRHVDVAPHGQRFWLLCSGVFLARGACLGATRARWAQQDLSTVHRLRRALAAEPLLRLAGLWCIVFSGPS